MAQQAAQTELDLTAAERNRAVPAENRAIPKTGIEPYLLDPIGRGGAI